MKPIKPAEAKLRAKGHIPEGVFRVFNKLIVENFRGNEATVLQQNVIELIQEVYPVSIAQILELKWLNVEPYYEAEGWEVIYDKSDYVEDLSVFTFRCDS